MTILPSELRAELSKPALDGIVRWLRTLSDPATGQLNFAYLPAFSGARVYRLTAFNHNSSGNFLAITFESAVGAAAEDFDVGGWHSLTTNTSRMTVPSGINYVIAFGGVIFAGNATGSRSVTFWKDGAEYNNSAKWTIGSLGATAYQFVISDIIAVTGGSTYLELAASQNSGGNLNINAGNTFFAVFGFR